MVNLQEYEAKQLDKIAEIEHEVAMLKSSGLNFSDIRVVGSDVRYIITDLQRITDCDVAIHISEDSESHRYYYLDLLAHVETQHGNLIATVHEENYDIGDYLICPSLAYREDALYGLWSVLYCLLEKGVDMNTLDRLYDQASEKLESLTLESIGKRRRFNRSKKLTLEQKRMQNKVINDFRRDLGFPYKALKRT